MKHLQVTIMNKGKLINIILYYKNTHVKVHTKRSNDYKNSENAPVKSIWEDVINHKDGTPFQ